MKILYYIFLAIIGIIAIGVIVPLLPIPGNYQILTVLSGSMEPAIKTGSLVIVKPSVDYKVGDIITFKGDMKKPTTHRIYSMRIEEGNAIYSTKGDANNAPDNKEVKAGEITGKVLFTLPFVGYAVDTAKKPWGFALIVIIPGVVIIGDEIRKICLQAKKIKENKKVE